MGLMVLILANIMALATYHSRISRASFDAENAVLLAKIKAANQ